MRDITSLSKLVFYKTEKYDFGTANTFDASTRPRPHFCVGLVLEGSAVYHDCEDGRDIAVGVGDLIFVPVGCRYVSVWEGAPAISYVSMHFMFDHGGAFTKEKGFLLQKITPQGGFEATRALFMRALATFNGSETERLLVLGEFYAFLGALLPRLARKTPRRMDERIWRAVSHVAAHYKEPLTVDELARVASVSTSRFYPLFRAALGTSPIDYINETRINRAILLLLQSENYSIEEISERVGFESAAYFRRVFKSVTGMSPRAYRGAAGEI